MNIEKIPMYATFDVVVVGGGTAGFAAAISAARQGAKTLILEKNAYLGGTSTGGMINQFLGFRADETEEDQTRFFGEVHRRLLAQGAAKNMETIYLCGLKEMDVLCVPYEASALKRVMDTMARESGVQVLFHTTVVGLEKKDNAIEYLYIYNTQGLQKVSAKVYIDASFHAAVAAEAGCQWVIGDSNGIIQPGTLIFKYADVDAQAYAAVPEERRRELAKKGIDEGVIFVDNLLARESPDGTFQSNMSRVTINPLEADSMTNAEIAAREQVEKVSRFFISNVPGFEHARVVATGDFMGQRDSRRIVGQYVLRNQDIMDGTEFPDSIAASSYPIDIHDTDGVSSVLIKPKTGVFHIPWRCLVTKVENLVLAGRCISADYEAHAALRPMVSCFRIGEAAGLGAAESIRQGIAVNALDGCQLRPMLNS